MWTVAVNPDRYPYSYKDQKGNWTGISVKLFDLLARRAGIYYRLLDADTRDDYMDLLQNGKADLSLAFFNDLSHAEQLGYKLTDPYLSAGFSWVRLRRDTEMADHRHGRPAGQGSHGHHPAQQKHRLPDLPLLCRLPDRPARG